MRDAFPTFRRFHQSLRTRVFWRTALLRLGIVVLCAALVGLVSNIVSSRSCTRLVRAEIIEAASYGEATGRLRWLSKDLLFVVSPSGYSEGINKPITVVERLYPRPALLLPKDPPPAPWAFAYPRFWPVPFVVRVHYGFDGGPLWFEAGYYDLVVIFGRVVHQRRVAQFLT